MQDKRDHNNIGALSDYLYIAVPILMIVIGHSLMKIAADVYLESSNFLNIYLLVGYGLLYVRGFVWILIIRRVNLSIAYPVLSLSYIAILAVSFFFFEEPVTRGNIVGTVCIIFGVVLLMRQKGKG